MINTWLWISTFANDSIFGGYFAVTTIDQIEHPSTANKKTRNLQDSTANVIKRRFYPLFVFWMSTNGCYKLGSCCCFCVGFCYRFFGGCLVGLFDLLSPIRKHYPYPW